MTGEGHKDWLSDCDFHPGYAAKLSCVRFLLAWLSQCSYVQDYTQLQFLQFFAQLQILRKLRFLAILVIFAIFVKFAVLVEPFQPQIWTIFTELHVQILRKLRFLAILVIFAIFVKIVVFVEPLTNTILNVTWISFVLLTCCLTDDKGSTGTANFVKISIITNFRSFRKFRTVEEFSPGHISLSECS